MLVALDRKLQLSIILSQHLNFSGKGGGGQFTEKCFSCFLVVENIKQCFKNMQRQLLEVSGQTAEYAGKVQGSTRAQILRGAVGRCLAS